MSLCTKCGAQHERTRGRLNWRPAAYCAACHAAYMRQNRKKHSQLGDESRARANARAYAHVYLKRGKLKREPCEVEGCEAPAQMHHDDYSQPLKVRWICVAHHLALHAGERLIMQVIES